MAEALEKLAMDSWQSQLAIGSRQMIAIELMYIFLCVLRAIFALFTLKGRQEPRRKNQDLSRIRFLNWFSGERV